MLNNPILITLLAVGFVLISVGIILYFLVFRKKIKAKIEISNERREERRETNAKSKDLAANVFKDEQEKINNAPTKEEIEAFDEKIEELVNANKISAINSRNLKSQVKKKEPPEEEKEKEEPDKNDGSFDFMSQFRKK